MPGLTIEPKMRKISVDWKSLFTQFFGEKNMSKQILSKLSTKEIMGPRSPSSIDPIFQGLFAGVSPSLQALGRSDVEMWEQNTMEMQIGLNRYLRLSRPAQWWSLAVAATSTGGTSRCSIDHCRIRWKADQLVNLDEEGEVIEMNVMIASKIHQSAINTRNNEGLRKGRICDQCRKINIGCARQNGAIPCNSCVASNLQCHEELASRHRNLEFPGPQAPHAQWWLMRQVAGEGLDDQPLSI